MEYWSDGYFQKQIPPRLTIIPSFQHSIISDLLNFGIHLTFGFCIWILLILQIDPSQIVAQHFMGSTAVE
jgi:hypothetical protein